MNMYSKPFTTLELSDVSTVDMDTHVKIFVNGAWLGISLTPYELFTNFPRKEI